MKYETNNYTIRRKAAHKHRTQIVCLKAKLPEPKPLDLIPHIKLFNLRLNTPYITGLVLWLMNMNRNEIYIHMEVRIEKICTPI